MKRSTVKLAMMSLVILSGALSAVSARADNPSQQCSDQIKEVVEAQAQKDFPGKTLTAVMPPVYFDGGSCDSYQVPLVDPEFPNLPVVTYGLMTNETCSVIRLYKE